MKAILLDTQAWAWTLDGYAKLSAPARDAVERAETIFVSPISFLEIGQWVQSGRWPEMLPYVHQLSVLLEQQGGLVAALEPSICVDAAMMEWSHRDPYDRILAATARYYALPLVSADAVFDGRVPRIW